METWLKARSWEKLDEPFLDGDSVAVWTHDRLGHITFATRLFDDNNRLLLFTEGDWDDSWITRVKPTPSDDNVDIPF